MAESTPHPLSPRARLTRALLVTLAIAAGGAAVGLLGGLLWSAVAPKAVFSVSSPGVAYVVNPETSSFIAADGWFSAIALVGGAIIGLAGYLLGVRRYGPLPALGALGGATAAAFVAWWVGSHMGLAVFRHRLGTSRPGTLLRQPADLGAHGALAFWPLAAGAVIGGIELVIALRERQRGAEPRHAIGRGSRPAGPPAGLHRPLNGIGGRPGLDGMTTDLDGRRTVDGLDGLDRWNGWAAGRDAPPSSDQYDR